MSVKRITKFTAREDRTPEMAEFLLSILPLVKNSEGCISCTLMQGKESPEQFFVFEEWETLAAHKASVQNIAPELMKKAMSLLAALPEADYFTTIG
jgi:quinol monooxygenase YgiN